MLRYPAVLLCLLCACLADGDVETTFDPCSPLTVVPGGGTEAGERRSVEEAVDAWSRVLPTRIRVGARPADGSPALAVVFESGDTAYRAVYWENLAEISVSRDRLDPADFPIAIAHELGHAFGLGHVDRRERISVMNVGNLEVPPGELDAQAVRALWPACDAAGRAAP